MAGTNQPNDHFGGPAQFSMGTGVVYSLWGVVVVSLSFEWFGVILGHCGGRQEGG